MNNAGFSRRLYLATMGAGVFAPLLGRSALGAVSTTRKPARPYLIAHRGGVVDATRSENSLAALLEAAARGYTHVEVDLRCTRDGRAVCLHDRSLKRTTGIDTNIDEVTLKDLHELVSADIVPTFEIFARICAEKDVSLMLDVKKTPDTLVSVFADELTAMLKRYGLLDGAFLIGSEPVISRIPAPARLKWRESFDVFRKDVLDRGGDASRYFAFNSPRDFTPEDVAAFRRAGVEVVVTVNLLHYLPREPIAPGESDLIYAREINVDGYQIDAEYEAFTRALTSRYR